MVIVPVDDSVEAKDVIYRVGEEPEDPNRGPTLELGFRFKGRCAATPCHALSSPIVVRAVPWGAMLSQEKMAK
eukprot:Skav202285  [mRNA]  locus=scaffold3364:4107:4730:+ [translate_table: standard]